MKKDVGWDPVPTDPSMLHSRAQLTDGSVETQMGRRRIDGKTGTKRQRIYGPSENISEVREAAVSAAFAPKTCPLRLQSSPEQARHGVPGGVVQRSVVLVGFAVGRVGIQSLSELLVALVQLAG